MEQRVEYSFLEPMWMVAVDPLAAGLGGLGLVVLIFVLLSTMRRRGGVMRRSGEAGDSARERIERIRADATGRLAGRRDDSADGETDAAGVRLATRLAAQLDGKAERLERLLDEARAVCERLEMLHARTSAEGADAQRIPGVTELGGRPGGCESGRANGPARGQDGERDAVPSAGPPRGGSAAGASVRPGPDHAAGSHAPRGLSDDPLMVRIFTLADSGLPAVEIARQIDEPTGKVELVLALREASRSG